jgi:hypothetical protein
MGMLGEVWNCPHCGEQILRSAISCPACKRRLHFDAVVTPPSEETAICPLMVEGIIRHPETEAAGEYSVLVEVRDQRGQTIARRVVGVGAIQPGEARGITLRVELHPAEKSPATTDSSRAPGVR